MNLKNTTERPKKRKVFRVCAVVCFAAAATLVVITYLLSSAAFQRSLLYINGWFSQIENYVASFSRTVAFFIIIGLFLSKSFIPILPFSVIFISCGMVFPTPLAVLINTAGICLMCSVKFLLGKKFGGGQARRLAGKSNRVTDFMKLKDNGNKWMLTLMCFMPFFPVGTVSRLYGATGMNLRTFLSLSVLGFLPRLVMWSYVGVNILNPITPAFTAPFVVLLVISGISLLVLDKMLIERK